MDDSKRQVPDALRKWFIVHFAADMLFAIPLMVMPQLFLTILGWQTVDPIAARMASAALFGIGIESLLSRNSSPDSFRTMLRLKIIWSSSALLGLAIGLVMGYFGMPITGISLLVIFLLFDILWVYWFVRLK